MELRQLEAFVAVAKEGGFTRASEILMLTQPAVTRQIGGLEAELRVRLIDRLGRRVALTAAGDVFLPYAITVLQAVAEAKVAVADVAGGVSGRLSVGVSSTAATYILPPILRRFHDAFPRVELSLRTGPSGHTVDLVAANAVDIGIAMDSEERPGIHFEPLAQYVLAVVVHPEHPLAKDNGSGVTVNDLAEQPMVIMQEGTNLRSLTDRILSEGGVTAVVAMELDNVEAIKKMIAAQLGISILPQISVADEVRSGLLRMLPLDGGIHRRQISAVYREDKYLSSAMAAFMNTMRDGISN